MIYKSRNKHGFRCVDTKRNIGLFKNGHIFVAAYDKEAKIDLIEFLKSQGFTYDTSLGSRESIIETGLPLRIDLKRRSISLMGNVTCAAAAASSKAIISEKEFYILYSIFEE